MGLTQEVGPDPGARLTLSPPHGSLYIPTALFPGALLPLSPQGTPGAWTLPGPVTCQGCLSEVPQATAGCG